MPSKFRLDHPVQNLIPASLIYLALPYIIFFCGWLRWYCAVLFAGLLVIAVYFSWRAQCWDRQAAIAGIRPNQTAVSGSASDSISGSILLLLVLTAALFLGLSGIGGFGYQDTDWIKHNAILKDLIEHPWPVSYPISGQTLPMVYYLAYYLPAALLGKLAGWQLANLGLYLWSLIGLVLALLWFLVLSGLVFRKNGAAFALLLFFLLFSGLDVIGQWVVRGLLVPLRPEVLAVLRWGHIEQWAIAWQYSSNTTLLFWVPHQALAGWIATGVVLHSVLSGASTRLNLLPFSLTALWSPFITIGLLPFVLAGFFIPDGSLPHRLRRSLTLPNLGGLLVLALCGLYYAAKLFSPAPWAGAQVSHGFSLASAADSQNRWIGLGLILLFCLLEFGLYSLLLLRPFRHWHAQEKVVFLTALACLVLFPFYKIGLVNDFVMRASIPALFILAVFIARSLAGVGLTRLARLALILLLLIGSVTSLIELNRHARGVIEAGALVSRPELSEVLSIDEWSVSTAKDLAILWQYLGDSGSLFCEYFMK